MTINERIKTFRKNTLHLNQRQFAADLGMAQTGVSSMEQNGATITDRVIKSICLSYNLNENWLRTGIEPIYNETDKFNLNDFVKKHGMTELELEIVKTYFELDPNIRAMVLEHFKKSFNQSNNSLSNTLDQDTTEELEDSYKKSRLNSASNISSSAMSTTSGTEKSISNK